MVKSLNVMGDRIDSLVSDVVTLQRQVVIVANLRQLPSSPNRQLPSSPIADTSDNPIALASTATDRDSERSSPSSSTSGFRFCSLFFHSSLLQFLLRLLICNRC